MVKLVVVAGVLLAAVIAEVTCVEEALRPYVEYRRGQLRATRELYNDELFLDEPGYIEYDLDGHSRVHSVGTVEPGPTRVVRSILPPEPDHPLRPSFPGPSNPFRPLQPGRPFPIYARSTRELHNARSILPAEPDLHPMRPSVPGPFNPFHPRPGQPRGPLPIYARSTRDLHNSVRTPYEYVLPGGPSRPRVHVLKTSSDNLDGEVHRSVRDIDTLIDEDPEFYPIRLIRGKAYYDSNPIYTRSVREARLDNLHIIPGKPVRRPKDSSDEEQ